MKSLVVDKKISCINTIRIIAAIQVFFGHAIPEFSVNTAENPILKAIVSFLMVFEGVPVFFFLSGFLMWDSIQRTKDFKTYVSKRVARLYPELIGGIIINAIIMTALYGSQIEWLPFITFQFTQVTFLQFWTPESLRGYATGTPNGPLWTICVMLQAYLVLWFVRKLLHKKQMWIWLVCIAATSAINIFKFAFEGMVPAFFYKLFFYTFLNHIWLFLIGAFVSEFFDCLIVVLKKYWWVFFLISIFAVQTGIDIGTYKTIKSIGLGLGIIGFAYSFPELNIKWDISYGLYIYHMIVINVMIHFGLSGIYSLLGALIISLVCAILSYATIGGISRTLRQKKSG